MSDQIAALERAAADFARRAETYCAPDPRADRLRADAATLRTLADSLRAGGERAQIVAWLRAEAAKYPNNSEYCAFAKMIAAEIEEQKDAIASGAHTEGQP